jgi:thioester reductase-like protein
VEERLKKEILESNCFDRLRRRHPDFDRLFMQKVKPIVGDLLKDGLDLSKEDEEMLINEVNIFVNSAASVDFNARLDEAIKNNILGTLRVFGLARKSKNLVNFVHISTGYVNCNRRGYIEEVVYPITRDPEQVVNEMLRLSVDEVRKKSLKIFAVINNTFFK